MLSQNPIGLLAPAGTSKAIVDQIAQATDRALADATWQQQLVAAGFERAADASPAVMRRTLADEILRWSPVIKSVGLKIE
jgi:tripartite-type tricarboxylate transporter receptor subunit TctC